MVQSDLKLSSEYFVHFEFQSLIIAALSLGKDKKRKVSVNAREILMEILFSIAVFSVGKGSGYFGSLEVTSERFITIVFCRKSGHGAAKDIFPGEKVKVQPYLIHS